MNRCVPPSLEQALRKNLEAQVNLIIYTQGPAEIRKEQAQTAGLDVRYVFHLTNSLAVTGPAHIALDIAKEDWVDRIEQDQEMHITKENRDDART
ncbi:MAG: hypothetical protein GXP41_01210 [Chloroflexi bacterium]|nr:hypothetical protein [Chloroflexota bacterium]